MAYQLTQEQADEVVRTLGLDARADDYELVNGVHTYFLEVPYVLRVYADAQVQLLEESDEGQARDTGLAESKGVDYGVVELIYAGQTKGYIDLMSVDTATPEERHIHDLRVLDITERAMRTGS